MLRKRLYMTGVVTFVSAMLLSCSSKDHDTPEQAWEEKFRNLEANLTERYQSVRFPPRDFTERRVFSYNLQKLLVNEDRRPVLFDGFLDDITKDGDRFIVHFTSRLSEDDSAPW